MNNYFVYGHYLKDSNKLFYIGKGNRDRATAVSNRSVSWKDITSTNEWYSVVLYSGLSYADSIAKENTLIKLLKDQIINKVVLLEEFTDIALLEQKFYYDVTSPTGLRWKVWNGAYSKHAKRNAGDVAGSLKFRDGGKVGIAVMLNGRVLYNHRIIWALLHGVLPSCDEVIDHIDGDSHNNSIENLRLVSRKTNAENRKMQSNNKMGIVGVYKMNNGYGKDYIVARVSINRKTAQKYFEARDNPDEAFRLACEWRKEQIRLLNEQGAGYTERHGT